METFGRSENDIRMKENGRVEAKLHKSSEQNDWWKNTETFYNMSKKYVMEVQINYTNAQIIIWAMGRNKRSKTNCSVGLLTNLQCLELGKYQGDSRMRSLSLSR
jgi:hypothetical protein